MLEGHTAKDLARLVRLRVEASHFYDVAFALEAAKRYQEREGHLNVLRRHLEGSVELGVQLDTWRSARRAGALDQAVLGRLEKLGIEWEPRRSTREVNWAGLVAYARARGHRLLPRQAETIEVDGQEVAVGRLMSEARRPGAGREEEFDALGVPWRVEGPWDVAWQRHLVLLDLYVADGGSVDELMAGSRPYGGEDLGAWLGDQLRRGAQLDEQQLRVLAVRGVVTPRRAACQRRDRSARGGVRSSPGSALLPVRPHGPATRRPARISACPSPPGRSWAR
ncbi:helicase associated domain-containing protein [Streptomyces sp. NPDC060010]|uniref:helicase associated domain-containing protein n=1 Tax=Streptomyces sp. NPDC060010 TaxID=3347036 RepID=UPI0036CDA446